MREPWLALQGVRQDSAEADVLRGSAAARAATVLLHLAAHATASRRAQPGHGTTPRSHAGSGSDAALVVPAQLQTSAVLTSLQSLLVCSQPQNDELHQVGFCDADTPPE